MTFGVRLVRTSEPSSAKRHERRHAATNRPGWVKAGRHTWRHTSGWEVRHCGHPTGYAFQYLADAQEAVEREVAAGSPFPKFPRAEAILNTVLPAWRSAVAPVLGADFIDELLRRDRWQVLDLIDRWLRGDV